MELVNLLFSQTWKLNVSTLHLPNTVKLILQYSHKGIYPFTWIDVLEDFFPDWFRLEILSLLSLCWFHQNARFRLKQGRCLASSVVGPAVGCFPGRANWVQPESLLQHFWSCRGVSHPNWSVTALAFPVCFVLLSLTFSMLLLNSIKRWLSTSFYLDCFA